jgi:hypothetical protein
MARSKNVLKIEIVYEREFYVYEKDKLSLRDFTESTYEKIKVI